MFFYVFQYDDNNGNPIVIVPPELDGVTKITIKGRPGGATISNLYMVACMECK